MEGHRALLLWIEMFCCIACEGDLPRGLLFVSFEPLKFVHLKIAAFGSFTVSIEVFSYVNIVAFKHLNFDVLQCWLGNSGQGYGIGFENLKV